MNHKNKDLTLDQGTLNWLLRFLDEVPERPVGDHLSDDLMSAYVREELPSTLVEQMDRHLASCEECAERMEWQLSFMDILTAEAQRRRCDEEVWRLRPVPTAAVFPEASHKTEEGWQENTVAFVFLSACQASAPAPEPPRSTEKATAEIAQLVTEFRSGNDREALDRIFHWCLQLVEYATLGTVSREDCFEIVAEVLLSQRENLRSPDLAPELATQKLLREITRKWRQLKRAPLHKPHPWSVAVWGNSDLADKNSAWAVTTLIGAGQNSWLDPVHNCPKSVGKSLFGGQFDFAPRLGRASVLGGFASYDVVWFLATKSSKESEICRPAVIDGQVRTNWRPEELFSPISCSYRTWGHVEVAQHTSMLYVHQCEVARTRTRRRRLLRKGWQDIFSAAACGDLDFVKACVQEDPRVLHQRGPHGISLIEFALAGNQGDVVEWLTAQVCCETPPEG